MGRKGRGAGSVGQEGEEEGKEGEWRRGGRERHRIAWVGLVYPSVVKGTDCSSGGDGGGEGCKRYGGRVVVVVAGETKQRW